MGRQTNEQIAADAIKAHMRKLGAAGGNASRDNSTPAERKARASKAAAARWGRDKPPFEETSRLE